MLRLKLLLSALVLSALVAAPAGALSISSLFDKGDKHEVDFGFSLDDLFKKSSWDHDFDFDFGKDHKWDFDLGDIFAKFDRHKDKDYGKHWKDKKHWKKKKKCKYGKCDHDKPTPGIPEPTAGLVFGLGLGIVAAGVGLRRRQS